MQSQLWSEKRAETRWALVAIVVCSIAVRLPSLLHDGIWRDEGFTYMEATARNLHEFAGRLLAAEDHPPLFFLFMYWWCKLFGTGAVVFKLPAFIASIATVPLIYLAGREVHSKAAGLFAALFYAFAPQSMYLSTDVRPHVFAAMLVCVLVYAVSVRTPEITSTRLSLIAAISAISVYTSYIAILIVPLLALLAFAVQSERKAAMKTACALCAGLLAFVPWLPFLAAQMHAGAPWLASFSLLQKTVFLANSVVDAAPVPPQIAPLFWVIMVAAVSLSGRSSGLYRAPFALAAIFLAVAAIDASQRLFSMRYLYAAFPAIWLFFGCVFAECSRTRIRWAAIASAIVLVAFPGTAWAAGPGTTPKSGIAAMLEDAQSRSQRSLYMLAPDYLAPTFAYYGATLQTKYLGFARLNHPELFRIAGYAAAWNDPDAIARASLAIRMESQHTQYLHYVVDAHAANEGSTPYARVWALLRDLRAQYPIIRVKTYPGSYETVSEYVFDLRKTNASHRVADK